MNEGIELFDENSGGEIGEIIKKHCGDILNCVFCDQHFYLNVFYGYEHEGGITDASGKKYLLYVECPFCEYHWSWSKFHHKLP
jgi:hypothetical protein